MSGVHRDEMPSVAPPVLKGGFAITYRNSRLYYFDVHWVELYLSADPFDFMRVWFEDRQPRHRIAAVR